MSLVLGNTPKLRNQIEIYLYIHKRMYGNNFESKLLRSLLLINILQETIVGHAIPSPHLYIVCEPMAIKKFFLQSVFTRSDTNGVRSRGFGKFTHNLHQICFTPCVTTVDSGFAFCALIREKYNFKSGVV